MMASFLYGDFDGQLPDCCRAAFRPVITELEPVIQDDRPNKDIPGLPDQVRQGQ
jgi:hypothetical protein